MAEARYERARDADDTDELLYTVDDTSSVFDVNHLPLRRDHCDLLLDSIDAQLSRLQVQNQKHKESSGGHSGCDEAPLSGSHSVSRDTGLGTQTTSTPMSCLDLGHPETKGVTPGKRRKSLSQEAPPASLQRVGQLEVVGRMRDEEQEGAESRREQCLWRLGRLLGESCGAAGGETTPPPPDPPPQLDSVCTEDFLSRFREEMLGFPGATKGFQWPEKEGEEDRESVEVEVEEVWGTVGSSQRVRERKNAVGETRGGQTGMPVEFSRGAGFLHHPPLPQPQQPQTHSLSKRTCLEEQDSCDGHEMEVRQRSVDTKAEQRHRGTEKPCDHFSIQSGLPPLDPQASAQGQPCSNNTVDNVAKPENRAKQNKTLSSKPRSLAGVPMWSFDTVSIDSDLDSVCTQQVTQCIRSRPGWHSFMQSIQNMEGLCTDQSDYNAPTPKRVLCSAQEKGHHGCSSFRRARQTKRDTPRYVQSMSDDDDNDDEDDDHHHHDDHDGDDDTEEGHGSHRRKKGPNKTPEVQLENMKSDWSRMEELLSTLRHRCETEEGKLKQRRGALRETEMSLSDAQQKKKHALQELAQVCAKTAQMEMEKQRLEASLRESKSSLQRCGQQRKRDSCLQPIRGTEKDPVTQRIITQDGCHAEATGVVVSVLERVEIERQLDIAKTELFAEQRRSRDKLDSMQELLDEAGEDLQRAREDEGVLTSRCDALEEKQRQKQELVEALECNVGECNVKLGSLEKIIAQKDLRMLGVLEEQSAVCAARDGLQGELQTLTLQHRKAMSLAQEQVRKMAAEEKDGALREQSVSFTRQLESVQISLKLREEEARRLREALEKQKEAVKKQEEQMHAEATEKVRNAVEVEKRMWEKEKMELEERNQETLEGARRDLEEKRKNAMALQKHMAELKTKVEELEGVCCFQQRKQDSALAMLHSSLTEERRAELKQQRKHMEQEFGRKLWRLEQTGRLAESEADRLRQVMGEMEQSHQRTTASLEQQLTQVTQEVVAECQQLCLLVDQHGSRGSRMQLPHSPTGAEATQYLQDLRLRLQNLMDHLHQELESQKQNASKLRQAKEQELCIQREKMEMEKQQALLSLKERLIQEHVEELSSMKRGSAVCRGCRQPGGGVEASLRRQLQAKDQEVKRVQSSMGRWKSRTAACLATKFEEELTAELERRISKAQEEKPRKLDGAKRLAAKESMDSGVHRLVSDPSLHTLGDPLRTPGPSDTASLRLLNHLQSRVRQLRAENLSSSPIAPLGQQPASNLSGSYLETVRSLS